MKKIKILLITFLSIFSLLMFITCGQDDNGLTEDEQILQSKSNNTVLQNGKTIEELANHWAPVHYQDIDTVDGDQGRPDYITRIDRDLPGREGGDWNLDLNWRHDLPFDLRAYVYYSVVESKTHYFIGYYFYHPLDATTTKKCDNSSSHCGTIAGISKYCCWKIRDYENNDMEGALFAIKKDNSFGKLEAVFVQSHGYIGVYKPTWSNSSGSDIGVKYIDERIYGGTVNFSNLANSSMQDNVPRVITAAQEGGHAVGCYPNFWYKYYGIFVDLRANGGGDHIKYIPSKTTAEIPNYADLANNSDEIGTYTICKYKLINVFDPDGGFWSRRNDFTTFIWKDSTKLSFRGGHGDPPWVWHGKGDETILKEDFNLVVSSQHPFTHNPANLCLAYLTVSINGNSINPNEYFSNKYEWNQFKEDDLNMKKYRTPCEIPPENNNGVNVDCCY